MASRNVYPPSVKPGIPKIDRIPNGWRKTTFGDVLDIVTRPAKLQDDKEYQLVNAKRNRGGIVPRDIKCGKDIRTKTQFFVKSGDFVISKRQIVHGACGIVPPELDGALVSNEYTTFAAKDGFNLGYLEWYSHSTHFQQTCFHSSIGVAIEKMVFRQGDWLKQEIPVPPLEEQMRITNLINTWQRAIDNTKALINAKQKLKKGLVQRLLTGAQRFPDFDRQKLVVTKYGLIPSDWNEVRIKDIAHVNSCSLPESTDPNYEFRYIELSAIRNGDIEFPNSAISYMDSPSRARRQAKRNDVIMSTVRPNLKGFTIASFDTTDIIFSTGFAIISPKCKTDSQFIYETLYSEFITRQIHALLVGSNYPAINTSDVENLKLLYPPREEERLKIATVLKSIGTEISRLRSQLEYLQKQRCGLIQQLLTGEIL